MRVLMDVTSLMERELTGVGIYIKNLVLHLQNIPGLEIEGAFYAEKFKKKKLIANHTSIPLIPYFRYLSGLNLGKYDIFHGPDYKIPKGSFFKKVVTIHDLVDYEGLIKIDQRHARRDITKFDEILFKGRPNRIITVSNFTRDCLIKRFPQFAEITKTVYLGIDHIDVLEKETVERPFPYPYILFVGTNDKRKNLIKAVEAFEISKKTIKDIHLVIVGKNGYFHEMADEKINASRYAEHIHRLGFINNEGLVRLYRHAAVFVFPSLYEGFGIPILEAMRLGCPVVTSNTGAMKEISGNAAMLISPEDAEEIAQQVITICSDSETRAKLIYSGRIRSEHFSWTKCAEETAQVYGSLL